jgi:Ulp1 family protease
MEQYLDQIVEGHDNIVLADPLFYYVWRHFQFATDEGGALHMERWLTNRQNSRRLSNAQIIIVPINQDLHWQVLCIVHPFDVCCRVLLMDSYYDNPSNKNDLQTFAASLLSISRQQGVAPLQQQALLARNTTSIEMVQVGSQNNGCDCGIFSILNVRGVIQDKEAFLQDVANGIHLDCMHWSSPAQATEMRNLLFRHHFATRIMDRPQSDNPIML